jgi:tetratricopeptide (TPR) repeat protein
LFLAGLLISFIVSPQPLWAQSASRGSISGLIAHNRLDDAEKQIWSVLSQQPDQGWALDLMAEIRMRQKRAPEAEALFRRALTLSPNDVQAYRGLGKLYNSLENSRQAIDSYLHAVAIAPADVAANVELAVLYQKAGQYKESEAAAQRVPIASRPPQILPVLAADYFATGEAAKVAPLIPSLLRHANSQPEVLRDFVTVLLRNGYLDDAAGIMETVTVKLAKPSGDHLQTLALVRTAQGKPQEAMALLLQALKLQPKSFELLFDSAGLAAQQNRWDEMIDFLRRADEVQPNRPEVLQKLSLGLMKTGRRAAAVAAARRLNSIQPDNPDNEYVLAFTLIEGDLPEEAEPVARKLAAARPEDANSQLLLGIAEFKTGDAAGARRDLQRSLTIDPHSADAHYYLALMARREGNIDAARGELEEVVRTNPEHASAEAELGTLYLQTGNLERARAVLEQAVKLAPSVAQYHYQLGLAYSRLGLPEPARTEMDTYDRLRQAEDEEHKHKDAGSQPPTAASQP